MGKVLEFFIGKSDTFDDKYDSINSKKAELNPEATLSLGIADLKTQADLLKIEDAILEGKILIINIKNISDTVGKDYAVNKLMDATDEIDGTITWRSQEKEELLVTPSSVSLVRDKIS